MSDEWWAPDRFYADNPEQAWEREGACVTEAAEVFLDSWIGPDVDPTHIAEAQTYCARCPVAIQCFDHARRTHEDVGVHGGVYFGSIFE